VSGTVTDSQGHRIPGAIVKMDFGGDVAFDLLPDTEGRFGTVWSHGNWLKEVSVQAQAPGYGAARSTIGRGLGRWKCAFTLTPTSKGADAMQSADCLEEGAS
jgi:hypothetical protein